MPTIAYLEACKKGTPLRYAKWREMARERGIGFETAYADKPVAEALYDIELADGLPQGSPKTGQ